MNMFTHLKKKFGFTLVETVIVIAIFTIVMVSINQMIAAFYRQNAYAVEQSAAIASARDGVQVLVKDLREAVASQGGAYPLEAASGNTITFYSDIDRDDSVEKTFYFIDSEQRLVKEIFEPTDTSPATYPGTATSVEYAAEHVVNILYGDNIFTYYDGDGVEIIPGADLDEVRFIEVNLIVNVDPNRQPEEFVLRSSAYLRNLKPTLQ